MTTPDRTASSPNFSSGWPGGRPKLVIIHSTRSTRTESALGGWSDALEMQATLNHFLTPGTASAHWVISATEKVRVISDADRAWHAQEDSDRAYGIELTQPTPETPYEDGHYTNLAAVCRHYVAIGVPPVHLTGPNTKGERGFIGHSETQQGRRNVKSDPGRGFDWRKFLGMLVEEEMKPYLIREEGSPYIWITDNVARTYLRDLAHAQALGIDPGVKVVPRGTLTSIARVDKPD